MFAVILFALTAYLFKRWEEFPEDVRWVHSCVEPTVLTAISLKDILVARACPRPAFPKPKNIKTFLEEKS